MKSKIPCRYALPLPTDIKLSQALVQNCFIVFYIHYISITLDLPVQQEKEWNSYTYINRV